MNKYKMIWWIIIVAVIFLFIAGIGYVFKKSEPKDIKIQRNPRGNTLFEIQVIY